MFWNIHFAKIILYLQIISFLFIVVLIYLLILIPNYLIFIQNRLVFIIFVLILHLIYQNMLFLLISYRLLKFVLRRNFDQSEKLILKFLLIFVDQLIDFIICFLIILNPNLIYFAYLSLFISLILMFRFMNEFNNLNWILYL